jgi:hypothetical protein
MRDAADMPELQENPPAGAATASVMSQPALVL